MRCGHINCAAALTRAVASGIRERSLESPEQSVPRRNSELVDHLRIKKNPAEAG
jgi:hypothetical protein